MTGAVEAINQTAGTWWTFVLHATWQSSLVAMIALAVFHLARRRSAQFRYAVVVIALIKFVVPPTLSLPTGLFTRFGPVVVREADAPTAAMADAAERDANDGAIGWRAGLMLLHLAGSLTVAALLAGQWLRVRTMARQAKDFTRGPLCDHLAALARGLGLRRTVRLLVSPEAVSPMAFGLFRPSVLVPASLFHDIPRRQMDAVLSHELAHHRRGDIFVNLCQAALTALWWFNPVLWVLNRAVRRAREDCCDDLLLARKLTTDGAYCEALLKVATGLRKSILAAAASGFAQRIHPLAGRIRRIMDSRLHRVPKLSFATLVGLLAVAGVVLPGLRTVPAPTPHPVAANAPEPTARTARAALARIPALPGRYGRHEHAPFSPATPWDQRPLAVPDGPDAGLWETPLGLGAGDEIAGRSPSAPWPAGATIEMPDAPASGRSLNVYNDLDPTGLDLPAGEIFTVDMDIARDIWPESPPLENVHPFHLELDPSDKPATPEKLRAPADDPGTRFAHDSGTDETLPPLARGFQLAGETVPRSLPVWTDLQEGPVVGPSNSSAPVEIEPVVLADATAPAETDPALVTGSGDADLDAFIAAWLEQFPDAADMGSLPIGDLTGDYTVMPVPGALSLLALGALPLLARRRRRV